MELYRGGWKSAGKLRASFNAGSAASAKRFVCNDHPAGIGFIPLTDTVHAGINAGSAMDAVFIVNDDVILGKGLSLFLDLLIKAGPDDIEKLGKLGASFDLLNKPGNFLDWKIDVL